jgi:lipopolysaccharide export system permease protein
MTLVFVIVEMVLMMWVSPWGLRQFNELSSTQALRTGFDLVRPKEFISSGPILFMQVHYQKIEKT